MNWEEKHIAILDEMRKLLGVYPYGTDADMQAAYDKASPEVQAKYDELNRQNDEAVKKAEKQL